MRNIVALAHDGMAGFGLGVIGEVFGQDRSAAGLPVYDFAVATQYPGPVRTDSGMSVLVEHGLDRLATADLVCVPSWDDLQAEPSAEVCAALREVVARGGRIMSHCSGAFVLAAAGLLDGRTVATHWLHAEELARQYPAVTVDPHVLYVADDPIYTSAGTAAGVDVCLYLVRQEHGASVANALARRMVVPPHRDGGQAQFVEAPVPAVEEPSRLHGVLAWAQQHLEQPLTVEQLAARALMSPRSFARHFRAATGTSPHAWLLSQRVTLAQQLLEDTDLSVDEVARRSGMGAATTLRHHFALRVGTSPQLYRRAFRGRTDAPACV